MKKKQIGAVAVDSGTLFIGDPSYQSSEKCDFKDLKAIFDQLMTNDVYIHHFDRGHEGKGLTFSGFGGDGIYPVFAKYREDGIIGEIVIKFN